MRVFFCYRQSFQLPTTSKRGNQMVEHYSDNGTVLGSSEKLGGAAQHLIDGTEIKHICRLGFKTNSMSPRFIEKRRNGLAVLERFVFECPIKSNRFCIHNAVRLA